MGRTLCRSRRARSNYPRSLGERQPAEWSRPRRGLSDLEATDDGGFRCVKAPQTELVFQAGENATPATLTTYIDGKVQYHYSCVPSNSLTTIQLHEFTGVYRSDEVDMPYEVFLSDGKLLFHSLKSGDFRLLPVSTDLSYGGDLFHGKGSGIRIRFVRDTQGHITGALLNTPRVYNLRFVRSENCCF
jgi:hypothetical protein